MGGLDALLPKYSGSIRLSARLIIVYFLPPVFSGGPCRYRSLLFLPPRTQPVAQTSQTLRTDPNLDTARVWGVWLLFLQSSPAGCYSIRLSARLIVSKQSYRKSDRVAASRTTLKRKRPDPPHSGGRWVGVCVRDIPSLSEWSPAQATLDRNNHMAV